MPRKAKSQESDSSETGQEQKRKITSDIKRNAVGRRKKDEMTKPNIPNSELTPEELSEEVQEIQNYDEADNFDIDDEFSEVEQNGKPSDDRSKGDDVVQHPKPKYTYAMLSSKNLTDLKKLAKGLDIQLPASIRKDDLIITILKVQAESMNYRFGGGTLEILPENFGFLRPKGMLPTDSDVYLSSSQIRRFGLRNGDVIWGLIRPPRDQEHYETHKGCESGT